MQFAYIFVNAIRGMLTRSFWNSDKGIKGEWFLKKYNGRMIFVLLVSNCDIIELRYMYGISLQKNTNNKQHNYAPYVKRYFEFQ